MNSAAMTLWPGSIGSVTSELAKGTPTPIVSPRGDLTIRVDLPGLSGSQSTKTIQAPTNVSVNNAIEDIVNNWLNTKPGGID